MESDPNVRAAMELWSAVTAAYWPYSKDLNRRPFIRLVQEYGAARADERAEEIAKAIEARSLGCTHATTPRAVPGHCPWCATREVNAAVARETIVKPKTSAPFEEALLAAVRYAIGPHPADCPCRGCSHLRAAQAALEPPK